MVLMLGMPLLARAGSPVLHEAEAPARLVPAPPALADATPEEKDGPDVEAGW